MLWWGAYSGATKIFHVLVPLRINQLLDWCKEAWSTINQPCYLVYVVYFITIIYCSEKITKQRFGEWKRMFWIGHTSHWIIQNIFSLIKETFNSGIYVLSFSLKYLENILNKLSGRLDKISYFCVWSKNSRTYPLLLHFGTNFQHTNSIGEIKWFTLDKKKIKLNQPKLNLRIQYWIQYWDSPQIKRSLNSHSVQ